MKNKALIFQKFFRICITVFFLELFHIQQNIDFYEVSSTMEHILKQ